MSTHAARKPFRTTDAYVVEFGRWLRAHRGAVTMAGLLSFAVPVTFLPGAVGVMREPSLEDIVALIGWFALFGLELWCLLLVFGHVVQRLDAQGRYARSAAILGACMAAGIAEFSNGRGDILVEQGVALSSLGMHAYGFLSALMMALLFFAHLHRSRAREQAVERLSAAQSAQRETQRRLVQARLQALQARIDPQLLFEMLDTVRRAYEQDASRAERLLDELVDFLRAALPRLRNPSSTLEREAQLARAYVQLRALAGQAQIEMRIEIAAAVANARFPPGVLLPLIHDALGAGAHCCEVIATNSGRGCDVVIGLPATPTDTAVARVRSLLAELYGTSAEVAIARSSDGASITIKVPYEQA